MSFHFARTGPLTKAIRTPEKVVQAYTANSIWRNRDKFFSGHEAIVSFLAAKWEHELDYKLRKELFAFHDNKIAVQFWYEYRDAVEAKAGRTVWRRCYGLEDWTFAEDGKMRKRQMSGNDVEITEEQRWFKDVGDVDTVEIGEEHW